MKKVKVVTIGYDGELVSLADATSQMEQSASDHLWEVIETSDGELQDSNGVSYDIEVTVKLIPFNRKK